MYYMRKYIPVHTGVKSHFSDIDRLLSGLLSECVTDTKLSDLPNIDGDHEKFPSYRVGQAVELLVRYRLFGVNDDLFSSIWAGFSFLERFIDNYYVGDNARYKCRYNRVQLRVILQTSRGYLLRLEESLKSGVLTDEVIDLTLRLTNIIDRGSGADLIYFWDHSHLNFTSDLISNVRSMVDRSVDFLGSDIHVTGSNLRLDASAAFCAHIGGGTVDFYGENCLVDLKCHGSLSFYHLNFMRMIVYLLIARYTYGDKFKFGYMFNPRFNVLYKIDVSKIPIELIDSIESRG